METQHEASYRHVPSRHQLMIRKRENTGWKHTQECTDACNKIRLSVQRGGAYPGVSRRVSACFTAYGIRRAVNPSSAIQRVSAARCSQSSISRPGLVTMS